MADPVTEVVQTHVEVVETAICQIISPFLP